MKHRRWFLPHSPDVVGMLRRQTEITVEGMDALVAWSVGEPGAGDEVRMCEHRADDHKRELRLALTDAFSTPLDPEDIFELSRGLDEVMNSAKNAVREAEVMQIEPDPAIADMARALAEGTRHLIEAFATIEKDSDDGETNAADRAVKSQRRLEHVYRDAMSALIKLDDVREIAARREIYRRLARTSDNLIGVAERVWYSALKES